MKAMSIHYKIFGEGCPIVMLHGWTLDHQVMFHAMEPLFEGRNGWKRIYIDLPGMGQSNSNPLVRNVDDLLAIIVQLLDELIPNENFVLCGSSFGAYIASGIIHLRPRQVKGLLLMAPLTISEVGQRDLPKQSVLKKDERLITTLPSNEADAFTSMSVVQCENEWQRFYSEILVPSKQADFDYLHNIRQNGYAFNFDIRAKFEQPTLILAGRQDHIVGYQDAWKLIEDYPRATFAVLDMAGHNLQIEQVEVFNSLVRNWLNRIELEND